MNDVQRRARTDELVDRLRMGSSDERADLVEQLAVTNMPVARAIARRYAGRSQLGQDLEQVAYLALVRAAQDYDVARGHAFMAYAVPCVTGAVKRYFRDSAWAVRPPRSVQEQHARNRANEPARRTHDRDVASCLTPYSLDLPDPASGLTLGASLVDDADRTWEQVEARLLLGPHLRALPTQTRWILRRRFVEDRTQQEIADELGMSQYHVSRLLSRCLRELREQMADSA